MPGVSHRVGYGRDTEALLSAHGVTVKMLADIVRAGARDGKGRARVAGGRWMRVTHVRITEAGRQALAKEH